MQSGSSAFTDTIMIIERKEQKKNEMAPLPVDVFHKPALIDKTCRKKSFLVDKVSKFRQKETPVKASYTK